MVSDLRNSKNEPTWGVYGFLNSVTHLIKRLEPTHMVIAFDQGRSKKRLAIYPAYKANRDQRRERRLNRESKDSVEHVDDFSPQRDIVYSLMDAANICQRMYSGVEADDIISKIVIDFEDKFDEIIIVSLDHDMLQLIRPNVTVMKPSLGMSKNIKEEIITYNDIIKQYKIEPQRLPELWALSGDRSDNIKGAKGIGAVKAAKLIDTYGTLDNVIEQDENIKAQRHNVELAFELIKLDNKEEFPPVTMEDLVFDPVLPGLEKAAKFEELLNRLEFTKILQDWKNNLLWYKLKIGKRLS